MINVVTDLSVIPVELKDYVRIEKLVISSNLFERANKLMKTGIDFIQVTDIDGRQLFWLREDEDRISFGNRRINLNVKFDHDITIDRSVIVDSLLLRDNTIDTYVFFHLEEYTWLLATYLIKFYPEKRIIFLDKNYKYFWSDESEFQNLGGSNLEVGSGHTLYITSDHRLHNDVFSDCSSLVFDSTVMIYSLFWLSKRESFGELNADKTIFLIDIDFGCGTGMGDIIKIVNSLNWYAKEHGFVPVAYLHGKNQYLDNETDNMWEYYFEPLSDVSVSEALNSRNVISLRENGFRDYKTWVVPELNSNVWKYGSGVRFRQELYFRFRNQFDDMIKNCDTGSLLGVIMRGTDMVHYQENELNNILDQIEELAEKKKYTSLFLATEDEGNYKAFKYRFDNKRVFTVPQKRVVTKQGQLVSDVLNDGIRCRELGEKYLFITYCLSRTNSLFTNVSMAGTTYLTLLWRNVYADKEDEYNCYTCNLFTGSYYNNLRFKTELRRFLRGSDEIAVYGTGNNANKIWEELENIGKVISVADRMAETKEYLFHGLKVLPPYKFYQNVLKRNVGIIITPHIHADAIKKEMIQFGIEKDRIFVLQMDLELL